MPYSYAAQKPTLFTEQGQVQFLRIRDRVQRLLAVAGSVRMDAAIAGETGSSWDMLACVDRLVELREIREVTEGQDVAGQHRVFVSGRASSS